MPAIPIDTPTMTQPTTCTRCGDEAAVTMTILVVRAGSQMILHSRITLNYKVAGRVRHYSQPIAIITTYIDCIL